MKMFGIINNYKPLKIIAFEMFVKIFVFKIRFPVGPHKRLVFRYAF